MSNWYWGGMKAEALQRRDAVDVRMYRFPGHGERSAERSNRYETEREGSSRVIGGLALMPLVPLVALVA